MHPKTGESIAYMRYRKDSGRIEDISVDQEHRRKGVATGMYKHAKDMAEAKGIVSPVHSQVKTPDGEAWANSVKNF